MPLVIPIVAAPKRAVINTILVMKTIVAVAVVVVERLVLLLKVLHLSRGQRRVVLQLLSTKHSSSTL